MRDLFVFGASNVNSFARFNIAQKLEASIDTKSELSSLVLSNTSTPSLSVSLSPNKTKIVGNTGSAAPFWLMEDLDNPHIVTAPTATFSGVVYATAISNTHYAVGGLAPFLYVFDSSNNNLLPVNITGLGRVNSLSFSPDGSKLMVLHETSPYLRVYNTFDWSYVNPTAAAGASRMTGSFTKDGQYLVTIGFANPYITVFTSDLVTRTRAEASSTYYNYMGASAIPHPQKENVILATSGTGGSATRKSVYAYNAVTGEAVDIVATDDTARFTGITVFESINEIYLTHSSLGRSSGTRFSAFDLNTYEALPALPIIEYVMSSKASASPYTILAVERNIHRVSGSVRDISNKPVARQVIARDRVTNRLVATTTSDALTGNYELSLPSSNVVDIQFKAADGELLNDLIYARVIPEPVS